MDSDEVGAAAAAGEHASLAFNAAALFKMFQSRCYRLSQKSELCNRICAPKSRSRFSKTVRSIDLRSESFCGGRWGGRNVEGIHQSFSFIFYLLSAKSRPTDAKKYRRIQWALFVCHHLVMLPLLVRLHLRRLKASVAAKTSRR